MLLKDKVYKMLLLIDSSYLAYRVFHTKALQDLGGDFVIGGFLAELLTVFQSEFAAMTGYQPRQMASGDLLAQTSTETLSMVFCWDSKKLFRRGPYPEYKRGARANLTEEEREQRLILYKQINLLRTEVIPSIGFKNNFYQIGLEADDLIAMTVKQFAEERINIITSDRDLYQVLTPNCIWKDPWNKKAMTPSLLERLSGVGSEEWAMVKAIAGCTSDNVKGIVGVGEITAVKYLQGVLPAGQKKEAIESPEGQEIIARNLALVSLPHPRTKPQTIVEDRVSFSALKATLLQYEMPGLLRNRLEDWKMFCTILGGK
jgi:5'-3' exonuclease